MLNSLLLLKLKLARLCRPRRLNPYSHPRFSFILCLIVLAVPVSAASAESETLAAALTIQYPGVSIQLVDTIQWLSLPQDATMPLTVGDSIQTDSDGRAWLRLADTFDILIMPDTTLTLNELKRETDDTLILTATLNGHILQRTLIPIDELHYTLSTPAGTAIINQSAAEFAVWSNFEGTPVVTVAEGTAAVMIASETLKVNAGQSFLIHDDQPQVLPLDEPFSAARLIGENYGCPGTVDAGSAESLNVRVGPGLGYTVIGYILNQAPVRVVGITETGDWYRVQKFTGFGWVEALSVVNQCENLVIYPRLTQEMNSEAMAVTSDELELMRPFYGEPLDNLWFYRSLRE